MPSHLERIPLDVLTHIALFTIDPTPTSALDALLHLLLACRHIHRLLSIDACPQLYARLFREQFDLGGHSRRERHCTRTTSCLASEFRTRRRVLRRIRLSQVTTRYILDDLWTTYLMLLESDELNELQLRAVGVEHWILRVLRESCSQLEGSESDRQRLALAVSVACLVLSHNQISSIPVGDRNQVLNLLRPYTRHIPKCLPTHGQRSDSLSDASEQADAHTTHTNYYRHFALSTPNLQTASVFLTFAFLEATPLQVPPHLPATRAVAIATGRHGPTMDDFAVVTKRRTPLVADSFLQSQSCESNTDLAKERQRASRSDMHDEDFYRIARHLDAPVEARQLHAYLPGLLTGVWEGSYMVAPVTSCPSAGSPGPKILPDFLCRQAIQFRLEEYVTYSPWLPLPVETQEGFDGYVLRDLSACEEECSRIQFSDGSAVKKYHYEPFRLGGASVSGRDTRHALDVVIAGETPRRFEAAWGSYRFIGRVRLSDGLITLTRKQKADDDGSGTWVFEGYLRSRSTLAGRWSSLCGSGQDGIGGIFSVSKTAE